MKLYEDNRNNYDLLRCTSMNFFKLIFKLPFPSTLDGLKQLHEEISSTPSRIPVVQKRDPSVPRLNLLHVIARYNFWRIYDSAGR